ncbi:MAG: c-type cytochrome [Planctomycetota bacterium]
MMRTVLSCWAFAVLLVLAAAGCGGGDKPTYSSAQLAEGKKLFLQTCFACHGAEGKGIPNLGKDMTTSEFIKGNTDDEMLAFLHTGRRADHPLNTTKVDMPPKGGNPALTDDQLRAIIAHVRTLSR